MARPLRYKTKGLKNVPGSEYVKREPLCISSIIGHLLFLRNVPYILGYILVHIPGNSFFQKYLWCAYSFPEPAVDTRLTNANNPDNNKVIAPVVCVTK